MELTAAIRTSTVETRVTSTCLHRSSQVKFSYRSRSRKTSFGSASGRTGSACSSAPELSLRPLSGSVPLSPRGQSKSTQTWKPTNNQVGVAQALITASSEITPTAEYKLSSFVAPLTEPTSDEQAVMMSLFPAEIVESNASIVNYTFRNVSCRMLMDTGGQVSVLPLASDPSSALLNCRLEMLNLLPFRVNPMQSTRILHLSPQSDPVC